jgi:hypothetical protein
MEPRDKGAQAPVKPVGIHRKTMAPLTTKNS